MVSTIIRAREYIQQLQTRVTDLERMLSLSQAMPYAPKAVSPFPFSPQSSTAGPEIAQLQPLVSNQTGLYGNQLPLLAPKPKQQIYFTPAPGASPQDLANVSTFSVEKHYLQDPTTSTSSPFKRGRGSTSLFSVPEDESADRNEDQKFLEVSYPVSKKRRDSALLLPTADPNLFYYGHRGSMNNMYPVPLPFIEREQDDKDISCAKCLRGIDNLIMIDCDKCHTWFHIRCIGLSPERIPIDWSCANCPH